MLRNKPLLIVSSLVIAGIIIAGFLGNLTASDSRTRLVDRHGAMRLVRQGPLTISILESGTIQAREKAVIRNEVKGATTILWLIEEGEHVKKGDLLVELDASGLIEQRNSQEIKVQNSKAILIQAEGNYAVWENKTEWDLFIAKRDHIFAEQDLEKFVEGSYPNWLKALESVITLRREELLRSQGKMAWSKQLYDEGYLSKTELQQDSLAVDRDKLELEQAQSDLDLLVNYTRKRNILQMESNVDQNEANYQRTALWAKHNLVANQANLRARKWQYARQQEKLEDLIEQIGKTKIYAPSDGQVIYATSAGRWAPEPLTEGATIRERQELIHLPTTAMVKAEISIHEANLEKVKVDMPVRVAVDSLPGRTFTGYVATIAPLPNLQNMWASPDLKVYNSDIHLEDSSVGLRTGMSCQAEIIIDHIEDAVYVPVQSVTQVRGEPVVYVAKGKEFEQRKVETGLNNNRIVQIKSGLEPDERVLLAPPRQTHPVI